MLWWLCLLLRINILLNIENETKSQNKILLIIYLFFFYYLGQFSIWKKLVFFCAPLCFDQVLLGGWLMADPDWTSTFRWTTLNPQFLQIVTLINNRADAQTCSLFTVTNLTVCSQIASFLKTPMIPLVYLLVFGLWVRCRLSRFFYFWVRVRWHFFLSVFVNFLNFFFFFFSPYFFSKHLFL